MLPALLVLAAQAQGSAAQGSADVLPMPKTPDEAWVAVHGAGYVVSDVRFAGITADMAHDGMVAEGSLTLVAGDPAKGMPTRYPYLGVRIELAVPKEVDPVEAEAWVEAALPGSAVRFTPHLGRTVTVWKFVAFTEGMTTASLRTDLEGMWADAKIFAAHYGAPFVTAPPVDAKRLRFDPSTRLRRADDTSLRRVFDAWGWGSEKQANVMVGSTFPIKVNGRLFWVRMPLPNPEAPATRFSVERLAKRKGTRESVRIDATDLAKLARGTYYDGVYHPREAATEIDLGEGLSLADLRRRIETFARQG